MRAFHVSVPDLTAELVRLVRLIPKGQVTTYGDLAKALGDSRSAIWVASVLNEPPASLWEVAHRVVNANGEPPRTANAAVARLVNDGVPVHAGRVDLSESRFKDFITTSPLSALKVEQETLAGRISLEPLETSINQIAALDVSYRSDGTAVAAYVLMQAGDAKPIWTTTALVSIKFPYIAGYLSYRELPVHAELLQQVINAGKVAPVLLVDGNGILHPRRAGIATQLGVLADHPTIGVSKSLLCGTIVYDNSFGDGTGKVVHRGETIAAVLPPSPRGRKPIFVSPGHRCTLDDAVATVLPWRHGLRLPEPIRLADALSRAVAKAGLEPL